MGRILTLLSLERDNPDLLRAQMAVFSRQVPLLYITLLASFAAVAATHFDSAPRHLTLTVPAILSAICLFRLVTWWRTGAELFDEATAYRRIRSVVVLAIALGASFVAWSFAIFPYGNALQQAQVAFFMAITTIACVFCLMHVRLAAISLTAVVVVPFVVFFSASGNPVFVAIAMNMSLVAVAMLVVLRTNYRIFAEMVRSRAELQQKQIEAQRLSDQNLRLANLDSLTDLPNRRQFFSRLNKRFEAVGQGSGDFSAALIDLDGFKPVNDLFGHSAGDKVLVEVGRRLTRFASDEVFVARLGGDEFGLIIEGEQTNDALVAFGEAICADLEAPYQMPEGTAKLSGSIGFASWRDVSSSPEELIERADYALYHAKQNQRGTAVVFSHGLETELREFNQIEQALRQSNLEEDLSIVFQPIVEVPEQRTIGFEALARWSSPTLGPVPPDVFIAIAERSDLINRITAVALRKALATVATWPQDVHIAFNLSIRDISSESSLLRIVKIIRQSGVDPQRIWFEITESALMRDFDQAAEALHLIKRMGVQIALDDFGTGYSSLGYVHRLPLDKIKIDRSFVANIETNVVSQSIVKTVLDLCGNLGVRCVVEGIETDAQAGILRAFGCRTMQGYLFGRPLTSAQAMLRLDRERHQRLSA